MTLMEVVRDDTLCAPGKEGEVVMTNLTNYAMPFLRYNTGDLGMLLDDGCPCPIRYPSMSLTSGRNIDVINLTNNRVVPAHEAVLVLRRQMNALRQFQVLHHKVNALTIRIVKGIQYSPQVLKDIQQEMFDKFGPQLDLQFELVDAIPREKSGKFRAFKTTM
jgi:phenylacetate-CoA ligase